MKFFNDLKLVYSSIASRKARSFLTMLGIVIGVAGVIIILALGAGAQSLVLSQITKLGTNLIGILPGKSNENGPPAQVFGIQVTTLVQEDVEAIQDKSRFPHITAISGFVTGPATIIWRNQNVDTTFTGTQASYPDIQNVHVESGRFFDEREEQGSNVIVLGSDIIDELFGETEPIGEIVKIKNVPFQVIGVMEKTGSVAFQNQDDQVFIPLRIGQQQLLGIKNLQFVRAKVDADENVIPTIAEIESVLRERHKISNPDDDDFSVRDMADAISTLTGITNALKLFLVIMASISLVVGGVGIMNIMLVTVAERTREIGLRKAVGATNSQIRNQFLVESGALTFAGGVIGIIFGTIISYIVAIIARYLGYDWAFVVTPLSMAMAIGVSILTGVIFGLYPAFKASKLNPIEALRYE